LDRPGLYNLRAVFEQFSGKDPRLDFLGLGPARGFWNLQSDSAATGLSDIAHRTLARVSADLEEYLAGSPRAFEVFIEPARLAGAGGLTP